MAASTSNTLQATGTGAATGAAVGGPWGAVVGGALGLGSSLLSPGNSGPGDANNQIQIANGIIDAIGQAPDISKPLILQQYKQAGLLTPEMESYITAKVPGIISTNPNVKAAQMQALQQMQQRATGGLTAADRAALQQSNQAVQGDVTSRLGAIQQKLQEQGLSDSGTSLAMKLSAAQNGANTEAANANQLAIQSQQARDAALGQLGNYSTQLQSNDFGQQFQQQQAQNEMNRFNTSNQINQQARNVSTANNAQAANLANAQNVSNANTGAANNELNNQLQREMQQYGANVGVAQAKAAAHAGSAQPLLNIGNQNATAQNNKNAGIANLGQGIYGALSSSGKSSGSADEVAYDGGVIGNYRSGGKVPGQAILKGDHPVNDTVHAILSPGEIVVPRTLSESKFGKHLVKIIEAHNNLKHHMNGEDNG